jgi:hypothetical protein
MVFEAQLLNCLFNLVTSMLLWDSLNPCVVVKVLFNRHRVEDQVRLWAVADQFTGFLKLLRDIEACNLDPSRCWLDFLSK